MSLVLGNAISSRKNHLLDKAAGELKRVLIAERDARTLSEQATLLAKQREGEAKEQADLARRRLYDAKMLMTQRAYNDGDAELFRRLLNEQNNEEHAGADRRSFEWGFWTHRDRASSRIWRPNRGQGSYDRITGTSFSADGKWLGVAWINGLSIGSIEDRAPRFELEQEQPFFGLSMSPDRRWVTSGHGAEYYVWGVGDRKLRSQFAGSSSSFLPDGRLVALENSGVVIRDLDDDARTQRIPTETHSVIASSVDGKRIATADNAPGDGRETVQVWNVADRALIATFTGDPKFSGRGAWNLGVKDVAFSRDGRSCAMSGARRIFIWDIDGQKVRQIIDTGVEPASELDFSPDGRLLAVGGGHQVSDVISLYDIESGRVVRRLVGHEGDVSGIQFSPDGRYVSSGDDTGEVRLWDLEVEPAFKIRFDEKDYITGAQNQEFHFGPEDRWLAVGGGARSVLCDLSGNGILATLKGVGGAMALSKDGRTLVTSDRDDWASLLVWDLTHPESPGLTKVLVASPYPVIGKGDGNPPWELTKIESIAFVADGRSVVIGRGSGRQVGPHGIVHMEGLGGSPVRRLDLKTGAALWTTFAHREDLERIALSPDSAKLATSINEGTFKIIDAKTGREERSVKAHDCLLCDIRWSPDGRWLATGGFNDKLAKIWDARTFAEMHVLRRHTGPVLVVAFSSDSQRLATGGSDGKIEIWDAITGQNVLSLDAHDTWLSGLAFSRRGDRLISVGRKDTAIKVWDARP